MSDAIVFGSPVAAGHVRALIPLAKRLAQRGFTVVWAISGDANEPASVWRKPLEDIGVCFVDVDQVAMFERGEALGGMTVPGSLLRRVSGRANDVAAQAAEAIRAAVAGRPIVAGVYDYFGLWAYVAMRRLGVTRVHAVVSAFPSAVGVGPFSSPFTDPAYLAELERLREAGFGCFDEVPRVGMIPRDPALDVLSFTSTLLCPDAPDYVRLLGVQLGALPRVEDLPAAPEAHRSLLEQLKSAREGGAPIVLLSMGTMVIRLAIQMGPERVAFLRRLYTTLAAAALRNGATVVASTSGASAAELGVDEAALGPAARERVIAMPFVPQPLLFAHGLVDVMLMHGGANTFHEAVVAAVPVIVAPAFGDQEDVARAAARLGLGVCIPTPQYPALAGALPVERVAEDLLPEMLAPGVSRWKATAIRLATQIEGEQGLDAAEAYVLGRP